MGFFEVEGSDVSWSGRGKKLSVWDATENEWEDFILGS